MTTEQKVEALFRSLHSVCRPYEGPVILATLAEFASFAVAVCAVPEKQDALMQRFLEMVAEKRPVPEQETNVVPLSKFRQ